MTVLTFPTGCKIYKGTSVNNSANRSNKHSLNFQSLRV